MFIKNRELIHKISILYNDFEYFTENKKTPI